MLSESSFEIVCWRMLGCDTMRANKVVTSNDETKASHSARLNPSGSTHTWRTLGWIPFPLLAQRQPDDVGMRAVAGDWHVVAARGFGCAVRTARAVTVSKRF